MNYYMDLNKTSKSQAPTWEFEYSAQAEYNLPDLQPQSWADLVLRFQKNNTLFTKFFQYVCYFLSFHKLRKVIHFLVL